VSTDKRGMGGEPQNELVIEICRELYDRFAMGGWEPQDAHDWLRGRLGMGGEPAGTPGMTAREPVAELITIREPGKTATFACINVGEQDGYKAPGGATVISREPLYLDSQATCDPRIAELEQLSEDFQGWLAKYESGELDNQATKDAERRAEAGDSIRKALREALKHGHIHFLQNNHLTEDDREVLDEMWAALKLEREP
jgi:hypothetical protein